MSSPVESAKRDLARALRSEEPHRVKAILRSPVADLAWLDKPLDRDGSCALHIGSYCGQEVGVHALLEFGCDPNVTNQNGETPLHVAAEQRFEHMIDLLVDAEGIRLDAARKLDRRTALHIAASHGCCDGVRRLLEAGAGIDVRDRDGNTPVFLAVQNNKHRVVHELVSQGANLKLKNNGLQTCLAFAMKQSQDKAMIKLLVERKSTMAPQPGTSRQAAVRATRIDNAAQKQQSMAGRDLPNQGRFFMTESHSNKLDRPNLTPSRQLWQQHPQTRHQQSVIPEEPTKHPQAAQHPQYHQQKQQQQQQQQHRLSNANYSRQRDTKSAGVQATPAESDQEDDDEEDAYSMDSKIRGLCIIVNNQDYFNSDDFKERAGTDLDERRLERLFKSLRFHVKIFKNLDAKDIYWNLSNYAKSDHSGYDCYVCCILSHGTLGGIYGVDGRVQKLSDLTVMLSSTNCPSLAGKPKLFFIQACRGRCLQRGAHHFTGDRDPAMIPMANHETDALSAGPDQEYILPDHGDFLIGYATVAQHIAQRHREQGSVYVQTLCDVIERGRHKEDLLSLLTKVKYRVSKHVFHNEDGSVFVQMPEVKETLRKKIYFK
ncbi:hypothetical protein BOX15_Mlig019067g1 [Macrostomum lignano]|uniref:Caspase-8 n=2 Tax=Macrostomum lignano TaxID=282301 RepID=A0A267H844_9PLAT|nr:hypothetical protein BOX15_Mlig019067g1 [Macrostomum lignano]